MKLNIAILTIISVLFFSSCKTYQTSWYVPNKSLPMDYSFNDVDPVESSIIQAFYDGNGYRTGIKITGQLTGEHWEISVSEIPGLPSNPGYPTKSSRDAVEMIQQYFNKSSESSTVLPYRLEISVYKTNHEINKAYLFISCLTVTTINLLGFPFIGHKTNLVVKGDVYDPNNKLIKTYTVGGDAKAKSAYYWGYFGGASIRNDGDATLCRAVNSLALKDALDNMRRAIYNDFKTVD